MPDATLKGYRRYKLTYYRNLDKLILSGAHDIWVNREMVARCENSISNGYLAAVGMTTEDLCKYHLTAEFDSGRSGLSCSCGIYVVKDVDLIPDYHVWPVIAAVSAWGNYIEFDKGYRVQQCRLEHMWIEPEWFDSITTDLDVDNMLEQLSSQYGVGVEVRKSSICCGQEHPMAYWPSGRGPVLLCRMSSSHIVNTLKYMKRVNSRAEYKWKYIFEQELARREALGETILHHITPAVKMVDGKIVIA